MKEGRFLKQCWGASAYCLALCTWNGFDCCVKVWSGNCNGEMTVGSACFFFDAYEGREISPASKW